MGEKLDLSVRKLLRVLVAGGVALAGAAGAHADDKTAATTDKADQSSEKAATDSTTGKATDTRRGKDEKTGKSGKNDKAGSEAEQGEKQQGAGGEKTKAADSDADGVKGW